MDKELLYKSYLNDVTVGFLIIVTCKGNYRRWLFATLQPIGITNGDSNLPIHDLSTLVPIILLSVKLNNMLNIKTKFDPFQILKSGKKLNANLAFWFIS